MLLKPSIRTLLYNTHSHQTQRFTETYMPNNTLKNLHKERNPYNVHIYTSVKHSSCSFSVKSKCKRQTAIQSDIQSKYGTYAIGVKENSFEHDVCTNVYTGSGTMATHPCINK